MELRHHFEPSKFDFLVLNQILNLVNDHFSYFSLGFGVVKDCACVLGPTVINLSIFVGWIVELKKEPHQFFKRYFGVVKSEVEHFDMSSFASAHQFVSRVRNCIFIWRHKSNSLP
jgi:hypothetical protein